MADVNIQFNKLKGNATKVLTLTQVVEAAANGGLVKNGSELLLKSGEDLLKVSTNVVPA